MRRDVPQQPRPEDDDLPLDPAASAALIEAQRARVESATGVDGRLLFGAWGLAWLLGFGVLWAIATDEPLLDISPGVALTIFVALLVAAMIVTAVHLVRQTSGVLGTSVTQGAMYGWAWFLVFSGVSALSYALHRAQVHHEVITLVMTVVSALLVGALYMAGAAIWHERTQFVLGAWITVVTIIATIVGYPHLLLVMSLAGGGGMLLGAGAEVARRRARRPIPGSPVGGRQR